jgi:hypothetical protein
VQIQCGNLLGSGIISFTNPVASSTSVESSSNSLSGQWNSPSPPFPANATLSGKIDSSSTQGSSSSPLFSANVSAHSASSPSITQGSSSIPPFPANTTSNSTSNSNRTALPSARPLVTSPVEAPKLFSGGGGSNRVTDVSTFLSALLFHTAAAYMI